MKTPLSESLRRPEVVFGVVLSVVTIGLLITALAIRDWVREAILVPVMKVLYYIQLIVGSVPQSLFWLAVMLIGVYLAVRSFRRVKVPEARSYASSFEREPGRVFRLTEMIRESAREGYIRRNLAERFTAIAREAQAGQGESDLNKAYLELPPDLSHRSLHHLKEAELAERSSLSREVTELLQREAPAVRSGWERSRNLFRTGWQRFQRRKKDEEGYLQIDAMIRSLEERSGMK